MKLMNLIGMGAALGALMSISAAADARPVRTARAKASPHRAYPKPLSRPTFRALDRNGDGRVARREFRRVSQRRFRRWLNRIDRNGDGYLTGREKAQARRTSPIGIRRALKRRGPVSLRELRAAYRSQTRAEFRRLDRNRNGFVSRREYRTRGYRRGGAIRAAPASYGRSIFRRG